MVESSIFAVLWSSAGLCPLPAIFFFSVALSETVLFVEEPLNMVPDVCVARVVHHFQSRFGCTTVSRTLRLVSKRRCKHESNLCAPWVHCFCFIGRCPTGGLRRSILCVFSTSRPRLSELTLVSSPKSHFGVVDCRVLCSVCNCLRYANWCPSTC